MVWLSELQTALPVPKQVALQWMGNVWWVLGLAREGRKACVHQQRAGYVLHLVFACHVNAMFIWANARFTDLCPLVYGKSVGIVEV